MKKIRSIEDLKVVAGETNHVLTMFSGGLDSTYILEVLSKTSLKVTAMAVDVGDAIDEQRLKQITDHYGADLIVVDARQDFVEQAVIPAIRAQAKYLGMFPISSSLSRPIIAKHAVRLAEQLGCGAIVHTANQSQNSLRRLNGAITALNYQGYYGSPYEYSAIPRNEKLAGLSIKQLADSRHATVSGDSNLWCREYESGVLDNPEGFTIPETLFEWSRLDESKQLSDHNITIKFTCGIPTAVNGTQMNLQSLIHYLNQTVGAYQLGQYVGLEHLDQGEKVLEIREAPAAAILMETYRHLETAIHSASLLQSKLAQEQIWTIEAVEGRWGSALQNAASEFIKDTAKNLTGEVSYNLSEGGLIPNSIIAETPKYLTDRDAWEVKVAHQRSHNFLTPFPATELRSA